MTIIYVPESVAARLVDPDTVLQRVEEAFAALARGEAAALPVVGGPGPEAGQGFAIKSATLGGSQLIGAKLGSYWPTNLARGEAAHASTTVLLDPETGRVSAVVGTSGLTALRTAAADAAAVKRLARADADSLALVGAGHQGLHDALAVARVRPLADVRVSARSPASAERAAARLREAGLPARACGAEEAVRGAAIVIAATPAREVAVWSDWVSPGTHVSAMGADTPGKGELDPALVARARRFCDVIAQSTSIGEFQTAYAKGLIGTGDLVTLGELILDPALGRRDDQEVTVFDSSGVAIQDLAIAALAVERALASSEAVRLED